MYSTLYLNWKQSDSVFCVSNVFSAVLLCMTTYIYLISETCIADLVRIFLFLLLRNCTASWRSSNEGLLGGYWSAV
jgi:hypothetical protein